MLLGLALIAGPLLVAVIDAAFQIRSLAEASQELVKEGVNSARLSQSLFADITSLGRTVSSTRCSVTPNARDLSHH